LSFNVQPFTNRKWAISTDKIRFKSYYWITSLSYLKTKRKRKITLSKKKKRKSSWVCKKSLRPIRLKRTCHTRTRCLSRSPSESACQTGIHPVQDQHASGWWHNQRTVWWTPPAPQGSSLQWSPSSARKIRERTVEDRKIEDKSYVCCRTQAKGP